MSTFKTTLALGLLLLTNACGASTITASSRIEGGNPGVNLGPIVEARTPPNVEQPMFDRQVADRNTNPPRDTPNFRIESDCWRCR
jgi:hypothetical protein